MKVIVVGAGLAGLTAALALATNGHEVVVYERKEKLWSVGGGINITPGAGEALLNWGLIELNDIADQTARLHQRDLLTGEIRSSFDLNEGYKGRASTVLRSDLAPALYRAACQLGVVFHFNSNVTNISEDETSASLIINNETLPDPSTSADLILAADGVRSRLRPHILSHTFSNPSSNASSSLSPIHSNRTYYLALLPSTPTKLSTIIHPSPTSLNFWSGADDKFAITLYNPTADALSAVFCVHEPILMDKLWDNHGDVTYIHARFSGKCHPELQRVLDDATGFERWQLAEVPNLPTWRSGGGRMVVLGDAAHGMHPTAGQGFSSTVEEVGLLVFLLEEMGRGENVPGVMGVWEGVCKTRAERVKAYSRHLSWVYKGDRETLVEVGRQKGREVGMRKEDPELKGLVGDRDAGLASPEFSHWMVTFDYLQEARRALGKGFIEDKTNGH